MLKRIYIDNWRSFVNFEASFDRVVCLAGTNGVGKSSVLDLLNAIQRFVVFGSSLAGVTREFETETLTRWLSVPRQHFELDIEKSGQLYRYELTVEHDPIRRVARVHREYLTLDGNPLFDFQLGKVQLFRDDFSQGPTFRFDWNLSGLGAVGAGQDNLRLDWFRRWLAEMTILRVNPFNMNEDSVAESTSLTIDGANFASWYHHLTLEQPEVTSHVQQRLKQIWPQFRALKLERNGEVVRTLVAQFESQNPSGVRYRLRELSDGQRCLLIMHTLVSLMEIAPGDSVSRLFAIDEPVNFVSLPEIQPWLGDFIEAVEDQDGQLILSGHHPELLDYLGASRIQVLSRTSNDATRIRPFISRLDVDLSPSEVFARSLEGSDA